MYCTLKKRLPYGTSDKIFIATKQKYKLDNSFTFTYLACMTRIHCNKLECSTYGLYSPLREVEPKFVDIILSLSNIGCPISVGQTICLMQSLIKDTPAEERMVEFQRNIYNARGNYDIGNQFLGKISKNYYYTFMRRYSDIIKSNKG